MVQRDVGLRVVSPQKREREGEKPSRAARRDEDAALATENAVAALGRVLEYQRDWVDGAAVGGAWLAALPLVVDRVEARAAHAQLVRLVEASDVRCARPRGLYINVRVG